MPARRRRGGNEATLPPSCPCATRDIGSQAHHAAPTHPHVAWWCVRWPVRDAEVGSSNLRHPTRSGQAVGGGVEGLPTTVFQPSRRRSPLVRGTIGPATVRRWRTATCRGRSGRPASGPDARQASHPAICSIVERSGDDRRRANQTGKGRHRRRNRFSAAERISPRTCRSSGASVSCPGRLAPAVEQPHQLRSSPSVTVLRGAVNPALRVTEVVHGGHEAR
jgi:hypothetical protein